MNIYRNRKCAATLAEFLLTMMVLGVFASISIPLLKNIKVDKDVYKTTFFAIQSATRDMVAQRTDKDIPTDLTTTTTSDNYCLFLADKLNTIGAVSCGTGADGFALSNGAFLSGFDDNSDGILDTTSNQFNLVVDIDGQNNGSDTDDLDKFIIVIDTNSGVVEPENDDEENSYITADVYFGGCHNGVKGNVVTAIINSTGLTTIEGLTVEAWVNNVNNDTGDDTVPDLIVSRYSYQKAKDLKQDIESAGGRAFIRYNKSRKRASIF